MARISKPGLDYFPLDVNFLQDRKVRRISCRHHAAGIAALTSLLCLIYKEKGYYIYILSNYATDTLRKTRYKLTFLKYVDGAVFSCEVKQIKPESDIYQTLISRYHLNPEKSVFLDDRAENCEAARKAGIHAIQFHSFKQAAADLEKMGIK